VTFADLFAAIGTAYGVGDGATTFNLPDMRGRGALGIDNMGGVSADVNTDANADIIGGTLGSETVNAEHGHTTGAPDDLILVDDNSGGDDHNVGSDSHGHNIVAGGDAAQSTIDPKLASIWIIKN
jgi:microcystin-dependent protein